MTRITGLILLSFTACIQRPEVETTLLADMPGLRLTFGLGDSGSMFLEIGYHEGELGTCARVHESLRARVGDDLMSIEHAGSGSRDFGCRYPWLDLDAPPPADLMVLEDDSKQVTIDLGARLVRLLPEQPWTAKVGETVGVPYAPASALPDSSVSLVLEYPGGEEVVPFSVQSAEIAFLVPDRVGAGSMALSIEGGGVPKPWPCSGVECRVVGATRFEVPIQIQPPASM